MAIAFASATNAALTGSSLTQTSLTITKPTSTASGDLLVTAMSYIAGQVVTTLTGWTLVGTQSASSGETTALYYRICDGTEGSTFTWAFTTTSGASLVAATCLRFTGTATSSVLGVTATASGGSISTLTPGTLTGAASTSVGIIACGVRPDASGNPVLSTPSTSNWVANASAKTVSTVSATSFNAAIGVSYNLSTASAAPPACTTTAACEYGIQEAEFIVLSGGGGSLTQTPTDSAGSTDSISILIPPVGKSLIFSAPFTDATNWTRGSTSSYPSNGPNNTGNGKLDYIASTNYPQDGQTFKAIKQASGPYWDTDLVTTEFSTGAFQVLPGDTIICTCMVNSPVGAWPAIWTWRAGDNEVDSFEYHPENSTELELTNHIPSDIPHDFQTGLVNPGVPFYLSVDLGASSVKWHVGNTTVFSDGEGVGGTWAGAYLIVNMSISDGTAHTAPANSNPQSWTATGFQVWRPNTTPTDLVGSTDSLVLEHVFVDVSSPTDSFTYPFTVKVFADTSGSTDSVSLEQDKSPADAVGSTDTATASIAGVDFVAPTDTVGNTDSLVLERVLSADSAGSTDMPVVERVLTDSAGSTDGMVLEVTVNDTSGSTDPFTIPGQQLPSDSSGSTDSAYLFFAAMSINDASGATDFTSIEVDQFSAADDTGSTDSLYVGFWQVISVDLVGSTDTMVFSVSAEIVLDDAGSSDSLFIPPPPPPAARLKGPRVVVIPGSDDAAGRRFVIREL